ncbi:MAG: STAS domain-containing protein, partial [Ruminococcus sp.]|nr:STAS domain-containing protein [Ruminococcus sp.]
DLISETIYEFSDEMMAFVSVGVDTIILDMQDVKYISYKYMRTLLEIQIAMENKGRKGIHLIKVSDAVRKEMDKTGISELLLVE